MVVCRWLAIVLAVPVVVDEMEKEETTDAVVFTARMVDSMGSVPGKSSGRVRMTVDNYGVKPLRLLKLKLD
jgi:hypothetical protein